MVKGFSKACDASSASAWSLSTHGRAQSKRIKNPSGQGERWCVSAVHGSNNRGQGWTTGFINESQGGKWFLRKSIKELELSSNNKKLVNII